MEELKTIHERAAWRQTLLLAFALLLVLVFFYYSRDYGEFILSILATAAFIYLGYQWTIRWRDKNILAAYAAVKIPLFEVQCDKGDKWVWQRAMRHRELLLRSQNQLFSSKKIDVIEVYMNDPDIRFTEPTDEYWVRVEDYKRDYLDNWAKRIAPNDENWRKIHLHNQVMDMQEPTGYKL